MSQVRKYNGGGKTKGRTFTYAGDTYDLEEFKNLVIKNADSYAKLAGFSDKEYKLFREGLPHIFLELDSDNLKKNEMGAWVNTLGISSTGERDKNFLGGTKKTSNNAIGLATGLLDYTLNRMSPKAVEQPKAKKKYQIDIKQELGNTYMGGNFDPTIFERYDSLDEKTKSRGYTNRAKKIASVLDNIINRVNTSEFDEEYDLPQWVLNKQLYVDYLNTAKSKLLDDTWNDEDYTSASQAGILGLDEILGVSPKLELAPLTPEQLKTLEEELKLKEYNTWIESLSPNREKNYWLMLFNPESYGYNTDYAGYKFEGYNLRPSNAGGYWSYISNYLKNNRLNLEDRGFYNRLSGYYYLPESFNENYGSFIRVNPNLGIVDVAPASDIQPGQERLNALYRYINAKNQLERNTLLGEFGQYKDGGIIKAQEGLKLDWGAISQRMYENKVRKSKDTSSSEKKPVTNSKKDTKTPDIDLEARTLADGFTSLDWTRVGSAAADLVSLAAAYIPGPGTVVSGITGVGSSIANSIADFTDKEVSTGLALLNLGLGLGADVIGLIPGLGTSAKATKIVKALRPLSKGLIFMLRAKGASDAAAILPKLIEDPTSLTSEDMSKLAGGLKSLTGGGKSFAHNKRDKEFSKALDKNRTITRTMVVDDKNVRIPESDYLSITSKWTRSGQNEELKRLGYKGTLNETYGGIDIPFYTSRTPRVSTLENPELFSKLTRKRFHNKQKDLPEVIEKGSTTKPTTNPLDVESDLNAFKEGGVFISRFLPGGSFRNTLVLGYNRSNLLGSNEVSKYLLGLDQNNYITFNKYEDDYDKAYSSVYGDVNNWGLAKNTKNLVPNLLVSNIQNSWRQKYPEINNPLATGFKGWGGTGDKATNWKDDALLGSITEERTLGRNIDDKTAIAYNNILNPKGLEYYKDPTHGGYRIRPIGTMLTKALPLDIVNLYNKVTVRTPEKGTTETINSNSNLAVSPRTKRPLGLNIKPEDVIASGRALGTVLTNNAATRLLLGAMKPLIIDTYENYVPLRENYLAKTSAYNLAADILRLGRRIAEGTSDATLGAAALLESNRLGNESRLQGDLLNAGMIYLTGELGRLESNAAKARRTEVANLNKSSMLQTDMAKAQLKALTKVANWLGAVQPFLAGIEQNYRLNRMLQDLYKSQQLNLLDQDWYNDRRKTLGDPNSAGYKQRLDDLNREAQHRLVNNQKAINLYTWLFDRQPIRYSKEGSKLSARDKISIETAKEINKTLRSNLKDFMKEIYSIKKMNTEILKHMSSFTADLIKSAMKYENNK